MVYRLAMGHDNIGKNLNCKVLGVKQTPSSPPSRTKTNVAVPVLDSSTNMDFSQIEIGRLE